MNRYKKCFLPAVLILSSLFSFSCSETEELPVPHDYTETGKIFEKDGEKWVSLSLNSMNSMLQDTRTILPDCPDLYFSVTASTLQDSSGQADCSYSAAVASDSFVSQPFYATEKNRMSGLTLTLKVGRAYYFTVYGTETSPSSLCTNSPLFAADYTAYTTSSDFGSLTSAQRTYLSSLASGIYTNSYTYNSELVYYGFRQKIVEFLEADSIVKGTVQYFIGEDSTGNLVIYEGADNSNAAVPQVISVSVNSLGTEGTGHAFIPVDLDATYSMDTVNNPAVAELTSLGLTVYKIRFQWTSRIDNSDDGYMEIPVSYEGNTHINSRNNAKFALIPYMNVGIYDTDLILYTKDKSGNYIDAFSIHDTVKVLRNQESVLLGRSSYYTDGIEFTMAYEGNASSVGANASTEYRTSSGYTYSTYTGNATKGYKISTANIKNYFRTVFYINGSSSNLVSCEAGKETGSLLYPYKSIADAVNAIMNGTYGVSKGYGASATEWNIIVDGRPMVQEDSLIEYTQSTANGRDLNIVLRSYNGSEAVNMLKTFQIDNSSSNDVNITFTNVTWSNPGFKVFNNTGSGNINVTTN